MKKNDEINVLSDLSLTIDRDKIEFEVLDYEYYNQIDVRNNFHNLIKETVCNFYCITEFQILEIKQVTYLGKIN